MDHVETARASECLDSLLDRAGETGERIILTRDGKEIATIVHFEDAEYLQRAEDRLDNDPAEAALAGAEKHGTIPWAQAKAELGL